MTLQWVSTDLRTGAVLAYLPGIIADWPLRRTIGQYETASAHLVLTDKTDPEWERAVLAGASVLHVFDDADPARSPQWSGFVARTVRNAATGIVDLSLVTAEGYTDRRYTGDLTYAATGQNTVVADLFTRYAAEGALPGLPITVQIVTAGAGTPRDLSYRDTDQAKLYQRLTDLMAMQDGPEWTIEHVWSTDNRSILPVAFVGDRIGSDPGPGLAPAAVFSMPGCLTDAQETHDYGDGKGATSALAYSSGQGSSTPTSGPQLAAVTEGRPTFEFRWAPEQSIGDTTTLIGFAQKVVANLAPGQRAVALTAALASAPVYGEAWRLGDTVGYSFGGRDDKGRETLLAFPGGRVGSNRALAYELSLTTISPILAVPDPLATA